MFRKRREVYLDNNATTSIAPDVVRKMTHVLKHTYGNPSSLYQLAYRSAVLLEESRTTVASSIGAESGEIVFCGNATEGNNTILKALFDKFYPDKQTIVASPIEHPSVLLTLEYLSTKGLRVRYLPVDRYGFLDAGTLDALLDEDTFLVCAMLANNEIGSIQDVRALADIAHRRNVLVMSDCVQALGKIRVNVRELGVDYATFSAHKIHGPKGVGAIFVSRGCPMSPLIHGGPQESGLRAGTESLHNVIGFAQAAAGIDRLLGESERVLSHTSRLRSRLLQIKPDIEFLSPGASCLPNTLSVRVTGMSNAQLMAALDYYGIAVSAGSACNSQENKPSHVLSAIGLSSEGARETVRMSLSTSTTVGEIDRVIEAFRAIIDEKIPPIGILSPGQLDEHTLRDDEVILLDIRFPHDRLLMKGLSPSYETSLLQVRSRYDQIPREKHIVLICQIGIVAPFAAYFLRRKGFKRVSVLQSGLVGWKMAHQDLYAKAAAREIRKWPP